MNHRTAMIPKRADGSAPRSTNDDWQNADGHVWNKSGQEQQRKPMLLYLDPLRNTYMDFPGRYRGKLLCTPREIHTLPDNHLSQRDPSPEKFPLHPHRHF